MPLTTQVYKWEPATFMLGGKGNPAMDEHHIQGGVEILLVASLQKPGQAPVEWATDLT